MSEILLHAVTPCGVTSFHVLPPSRVRCINPVSVPAQIRLRSRADGAIVNTTPNPRCFAFSFVGGPSDLLSPVGCVAPVRSGLIVCQCRPPSSVFITYCVP